MLAQATSEHLGSEASARSQLNVKSLLLRRACEKTSGHIRDTDPSW